MSSIDSNLGAGGVGYPQLGTENEAPAAQDSGKTTVSASGGSFTVTDANGNSQEVDLGTLMLMISADTVQNLDDQIAVKLEEMQQRNDTIAQYTDIMSAMRAASADPKSASSPVTCEIDGKTVEMAVYCKEQGIAWVEPPALSTPPTDAELGEWSSAMDANIDAFSSQISLLNTDSQMDNIELQNLLNKRNNAFEMCTQMLSTNNESVESVLRNL